MPRKSINYSKTVIYNIVCKDLNVKDCYVGHTTDFTRRKTQHGRNCSSLNEKCCNYKVYQIIRENGGWDNWIMIEIEKYPTNDSNEALARERFWYEILNASLNTIKPTRTVEEAIQYQEIYREENKTKISDQRKKHYILNRNKIFEYKEANKIKIKEQRKEYNKINKDKINEREREKAKIRIVCVCGSEYCLRKKSIHEQSMKHQLFIDINK